MNQKKAKSIRKLARSMVTSGLVDAGTLYESKSFSRPAVLNMQGEIVSPAYSVKTIRVNPRCERGVYLRMKRDKTIAAAA